MRDFYLADEYRWCPWSVVEKTEADAAVGRSYEVLQYLTRSPAGAGLAQAVRYVSVRAYSVDGEYLPEGVFDALKEALSVFRLRGFSWYGCHPMPKPQVLEALSTGSRDTLESILLPAELLDHTPGLALTRLKSFSFLNRYGDRYKLLRKEDRRFARMGETIAAISSSLHSLGIFGEALWAFSVQRLSTLVELTIALIADVDPIGAIFTHCSSLRSVTVLVGCAHRGDLAAVLRAHPDALPRLTAFQLFYSPMTKDVGEAVAVFLRTKPLLERLELGHHWDTCLLDDVEPVLEILPELPCLRVLGMELNGDGTRGPVLRPEHLLHLSERIVPHRLTALSLRITAPLPPAATDMDWIQLFSGLRSCCFIYISSDLDYPITDQLQRVLFDHPPPSAELVGFNADMRWVEREQGTGRRVGYSESWPVSRVYNRTVEDFGCEEWEWLLRQLNLRLM